MIESMREQLQAMLARLRHIQYSAAKHELVSWIESRIESILSATESADAVAEVERCCPECGSNQLSGLVAAFYVPLNEDGGPDRRVSWESESEIGPQRLCRRCQSEFGYIP